MLYSHSRTRERMTTHMQTFIPRRAHVPKLTTRVAAPPGLSRDTASFPKACRLFALHCGRPVLPWSYGTCAAFAQTPPEDSLSNQLSFTSTQVAFCPPRILHFASCGLLPQLQCSHRDGRRSADDPVNARTSLGISKQSRIGPRHEDDDHRIPGAEKCGGCFISGKAASTAMQVTVCKELASDPHQMYVQYAPAWKQPAAGGRQVHPAQHIESRSSVFCNLLHRCFTSSHVSGSQYCSQ